MSTNIAFNYSIRKSQRATRLKIIVSLNKVEVVAPLNVNEQSIHQFVQSKQLWILSALEKIALRPKIQPNKQAVVYKDGVDINFQGQVYKLSLQPSRLKRLKVKFDNGFIALIPESQNVPFPSDDIKQALTLWMKQQSRLHVEHWVKLHAPKKNLYPRSIRIKTQKSRWGSCGIHNDVQINWLLIMAPPPVLEYVVVHELCHIKERNHSAKFWALVAEHLPDYKHRQLWLKQHGSQLMQGL